MYSIVTAKGQVTIPAQIREELGIKPGMLVAFEVKKGRKSKKKQVSLVINDDPDLIAQLKGSAKKYSKLPPDKFPKNVPLSKIRKQIADNLGKKYQ